MNYRMSIPKDGYGQEFLIDEVQFEDAGFYQCSATNSGSSPVIFLIQLTVECE